MATIYLSFGLQDESNGERLQVGLEACGYEVLGGANLTPTIEFRKVAEENLSRSDAIVVLLSERTVESQYLTWEISLASGYVQASSNAVLIPILIGKVNLPDLLANYSPIQLDAFDVQPIVAKISEGIDVALGKRAARAKEEKVVQQRIQENATDFVEEALTSLREREQKHKNNGSWWASGGYVALAFGVILASIFTIFGHEAQGIEHASWPLVAFLSFRGLVVIGLLVAMARYSFDLAKAHMHESLRNSDRMHAIRFGRFYMSVFADRATWEEMKDAFQNWNIDTSSSFISLRSGDFDPKFLGNIASVAKSFASGDKDKKKE